MLTRLTVRNLALVEQAEMEFTGGLNVVTGETGAGKSVLMGALRLLVGERADRSAIRDGEVMCSAEAVFALASPEAVNRLLDEKGLPACEEGDLVVRRIIRAAGSGQQFVNDTAVSLQLLRELGEILVDMHGPYDHQSLLHQHAQLDLLDSYGHTFNARASCASVAGAIRKAEEERDSLSGDRGRMEEEVDLLRYRIQELEQAELVEGEEEALREEQHTAGHAQRIIELSGSALLALQDGESNAYDCMVSALRSLEALDPLLPDSAAWHEDALEINSRLRNLADTIRTRIESVEADPARLDWLDTRLALVVRMKKKYGPTISDALETLASSKTRLRQLEGREEELARIASRIALLEGELKEKAGALRIQRLKAAEKMGEAITAQLRDLGFAKGGFTIELAETPPGPTGMDLIEFTFAPNPGENARALRAIASSGEMARVMLAVKTVLAGHDRIPVLIFDEIDANVGGEMGSAIGRKLREVSGHHQVVAITHLPQVAAQGVRHLAVAKTEAAGRTRTEVRPLEGGERESEIARMLGGHESTPITLEHARALLSGAKSAAPKSARGR